MLRKIKAELNSFLDDVLENLLLFEGHLTSPFPRPPVFISNQMEDPMDHQKDDHSHIIETESIRLTLSGLH